MVERIKLRVLPVVKAYPEPSKKYGTTVCVAGVNIQTGEWIRLYPVRFTELPESQRFQKYQPIDVAVSKATSDPRPESYYVDESSIEIAGKPLDTSHSWSERKRLLGSAVSYSFCALEKGWRDGPSLGMVGVREVTDFRTIPAGSKKHEKAVRRYEYAASPDLFNEDKLRVEALSFKFRYEFLCPDGGCEGHKATIVDWEAYALYRRMVRQHGEDTAVDKVREKYVDDICGANKDTYFYVGNMQAYPWQFLMLGAFYPKRSSSPTLFELQ